LYVIATIAVVEIACFGVALSSPDRRQRAGKPLAGAAAVLGIFGSAVIAWLIVHPRFRQYALLVLNELTHAYQPFTRRSVPVNRAWLVYYPTSLIRDYTASAAQGILLVTGCVAGLRHARDIRVQLSLILVLIGMPVVFFHIPLPADSQWWPFLGIARHLMMLVPAFWLVSSIGITGAYLSLGRIVGAVLLLTVAAALASGGFNASRALFTGEYARRIGSSVEIAPYLNVVGDTISRDRTQRVYLVSDIPNIAPGMIEWELLRRAADDAQVAVFWPAWPDNPDEGYQQRLRWLLDRRSANWIVVVEANVPRESNAGHGYVRAAKTLSGFELVQLHDGPFRLTIYRRST
jgi:hypothetical protein